MLRGLETPVIFLQNVVTDFLLGFGYKDAFRIFADHVRQKYNAEAGFITMNLPRLLDVLDELGLDNPIVCSNINKIETEFVGTHPDYEIDHLVPVCLGGPDDPSNLGDSHNEASKRRGTPKRKIG